MKKILSIILVVILSLGMLAGCTAKTEEKAKWVCGICGYVYEGDVPFEELPEDFRCPLCKQAKSVFVKK